MSRRYLPVLVGASAWPTVPGVMQVPDLIATAQQFPSALARHNFSLPTVVFAENRYVLPTVEELAEMSDEDSQERMRFFVSLFLLTYGCTVLVGTGVMMLGPSCCRAGAAGSRRSREYEPMAARNCKKELAEGLRVQRQQLVSVVFSAIFVASLASAIWSLATDRLSKRYGLDWEIYYLLFALNCFWLEVQAAVAAIQAGRRGQKFSVVAFFEGSVTGTFPLVADAYDTLKDVLVGALCLHSGSKVLVFLGSATWVYLALIHIWFIALSGDHFLAEMVVSYMPILAMPTVSVKETAEGSPGQANDGKVMNFFQNLGEIVLPLAYKQVTPTKRSLLAVENTFQGLAGVAYMVFEGGSLFVVVVNVALPTVHILMTFVLHEPLRRKVAPWFAKKLKQAFDNDDLLLEQRIREEAFESLDIFTAVAPLLCSVQRFRDLELNFWGHGIGDAGATRLAVTLKALVHLTMLRLSLGYNNLTDEGAVDLAATLEKLQNLSDLKLILYHNRIGDAGVQALTCLQNLPKLNRLYLQVAGNSLNSDGVGMESLHQLGSKLRLAGVEVEIVR